MVTGGKTGYTKLAEEPHHKLQNKGMEVIVVTLMWRIGIFITLANYALRILRMN